MGNTQIDRIMRYDDMIRRHVGKAVRPYRADGYVNMMTKYGTSQDASEQYRFVRDEDVPDELLNMFYENNGLFAKIIDAPAEEAMKRGFVLDGISDQKIEDFCVEALDELDWEETAMTAIKWARLFGGSIAVMLVNDGRGLEEPLNWRNIRSIDDIRVYDRSVIQPDYSSMFTYDPVNPFGTRGSRLGMPEFYHISSRTGSFTVHDSRCLVFQNGILPEGATNSIYQLWGVPEYVRINKAIRDAELAHRSAPKLLDRSVQPVYKMKDLEQLLATDEGEDQILRRLRVIDMARGMMNTLVIDKDGEEYDFKTFQFSGVSNVVSASCSLLSAITNIPQIILFGQSVGGLSATDDTSMENYYNFISRIQRRMLRSNLRYLLSVIFQAGVHTGEVNEVPKIKVKFKPLKALNDVDQAKLDQTKAATEHTKAQTAQLYLDMQAISPTEIRKGLASSDQFDVEELLDEEDSDVLPFGDITDAPGSIAEQGSFAAHASEGKTQESQDPDEGNSPDAAPAATKLPQDMNEEEREEAEAASHGDGGPGSGNFKHEGRPGEIGGSLKSGESIKDGFVSDLDGAKDNADFGKAVESRMKDMPVGTKIKTSTHNVEKIGDDEYRWQFKDEPEKVYDTAVARNAIMKGVRDGSIEVEEISSEDVASAMVSAGELDPKETSVKIPSMEPEAYKGSQVVDVDKEQFQSLREELQKNMGKAAHNDEIVEYLDAIDAYRGTDYVDVVAASAGFSGGYESYSAHMSEEAKAKATAQADAMERFINGADKYEGKVMRALGFDLGGEYDDGSTTQQFRDLISMCKPGEELDMGHISSWTTDQSTISQILSARTGLDETAERSAQVIFTCPQSKSGVDIGRFSKDFAQGEVAFSKDQKFVVKSVKQREIGDEDWPMTKYEVEVEEIGRSGRHDGGPGSGYFNHEGRIGQVGGSLGELAMKAQGYSDPRQFIRENIKDIKAQGMTKPAEAIAYWKDACYAKDIKPHETGVEKAIETIRDNVSPSTLHGWFVEADSTYKGRLEQAALSSDEVRNAGLNIAYENFKSLQKGKSGAEISFDQFLDTPITVYRGKASENFVDGDDILSFSMDRKVAEKFAGPNGKVVSTEIKPRDTIGSYQTTGEAEIFVRRGSIHADGYDGFNADAEWNDPLFWSEDLEELFRREVGGEKRSGGGPDHIERNRKDETGDTNRSVGVLVVKDGEILCGIRGNTSSPGMVCGPGGHVKKGETYRDAAIRETEEEFGITPTDLEMIGFGPKEETTGMAPALFLCTEYTSKPDPSSAEMMFARFMGPGQIYALIAAGVVFQPFADSMDILIDVVVNGKEPHENDKYGSNRNITLDNNNQKVIIKLPHPQHEDGGPGSGNRRHKGIPKHVGGSTPKGSAEGRNKPCTGFRNKAAEKSHQKHWKEFNVSSQADYEKKAIDFISQPVGGNIDGYLRSRDGAIIRFDVTTGEIGIGIPGGRIITYFKAGIKNGKQDITSANNYFNYHKKEDQYE